jgi:hypothetical protein
MAEANTWGERFPHPGEAPPLPGPEPTGAPDFEPYWLARYAWNNYVRAARAHTVAAALDELVAKTTWLAQRGDRMPAADRIAMAIGASFLDGSVPNAGPYIGLLAL